MHLAVGSRFGTYEALALIGAGGMGEVYRARDHKLGRDVAIKVLAAAYTADPERLTRFEREARILAALNHPNIATIFGFEDAGALRALVMELVDGETLRERLALGNRGTSRPLPLREALGIARQIAEALDAAHARGIVHRDLKPENVKVTPSGTVKVLDFGLAKIRDPHDATEATPVGSEVATIAGQTRIGTVLGTAAYMSPEQARGLPVDRRTDVWSFGCVLYELLTGRAAFEGASAADTLAAVLERDPDWRRLPPALPPSIRRLLQRCLQKDVHQRLRDIGDVGILIDDALADPAPVPVDGPRAPRRVRTLALAGVASVALLAASGLFAVRQLRSTPAPAAAPIARLSISSPWPVIPPTGTAVSPDGRRVAFVTAAASGQGVLVVRALDSVDVRALPGTEDARHPVWSPDGRSLAFHAQGKIKRVDADGGPVVTVADAANGGVTWSKDDILLFERVDGLWSVPAAGGTPVRVTTVDRARDARRHGWPHFLPDGRRFLYFVVALDPEQRGVYVGSLDSGEIKRVLATDFQARYAPPGHLLFIRNEQLLAQPFDLERLELTGQPTVVADGVWVAALAGRATFSVSDNGTLTYVNASQWNTQLAWFDRRGALLGELGAPDRYAGQMPDLSPDGRRVAIARGIWSQEQVWVLDAIDATPTRVTFDSARALGPVWSGDSRRLMYESWTPGGRRLVIKDVATGEEEIIEVVGRLLDWSVDGRFVVYTQATVGNLWALPLDGERRPFELTEAPGNEFQAQLSPDGRWIAYTSNESGREEIYVQRFPDGGGKRQVSPAGGASPRWRPDGTELYYVARDSYVTAVAVRGTAPLDLGPPTPLFRSRAPFLDAANAAISGVFDVTADGQRFLINIRSDQSSAPITIVNNWPAALR